MAENTTHPEDCPSEDVFNAFLNGLADAGLIEEIGAHLELCPKCCALVQDLDEDLSKKQRPITQGALTPDETRDASRASVVRRYLSPSTDHEFIGCIDEYPVRSLIARGGMGVVFEAWDTKLERPVAIKVLSVDLTAEPEAMERFRREARAAAKLDHPNILQIHAMNLDAEAPYLVMAYNDGESLSDRLKRESMLSSEETTRIGLAIASGLAAAHASGFIHRDIKPGNILISKDGQIRITDFGLAQAADSPSLTTTGHIAGTPLFMAPEQVDGKPLDARADLFSLGALLYRMLAGSSPFEGPSTTAIIKKVAFDATPRITQGEEWLRSIIYRLLEKEPKDRIQTANEVVQLFEQSRAPRKPPGRGKTIAVVGAAIAVAAWAIFAILPDGEPTTVAPPPFVLDSESALAEDWFAVVGDDDNRRFSDLRQAVAEAKEGSTITIHGNGRIPTPPLILDKRIRMVAAPNSRPVLESTSRSGSIIYNRVPFSIEGIALYQNVKDISVCRPLIDSRDDLMITHCRLVRNCNHHERIISRPAILRIYHADLSIANTEIYAPSSFAISSIQRHERTERTDSMSVKIDNSVLSGAFVVQLNGHEKLRKWFVSVSNTSFLGGGAFMLDHGSSSPQVDFAVKNSIFETNGLLTGNTDWETYIANVEDVDWVGSENLYHVRWYFHSLRDDDTTRFVHTLSRWNRMLTPPESHSEEIGTPYLDWVPEDFTVTSARLNIEGKLKSEDFTLNPELTKKYPDRGAHIPGVGPPNYENWRKSEAYDEWEKSVSTMLK